MVSIEKDQPSAFIRIMLRGNAKFMMIPDKTSETGERLQILDLKHKYYQKEEESDQED